MARDGEQGDNERVHSDIVRLREQLAELEHRQWAHWTRYMLENWTGVNRARWTRQMNVPYAELSEDEKREDRYWADKVLELLERG